MKKGSLHFLGRKNNSLFDTNVKMKDMDNVELVLGSPPILESGTASVRARPTVNHHASSYDSFQGFAVPTPTVPLLPPANGPKLNGSVAGDQFSNGSVISLPDLAGGDLVVPPPPSMAPPPLPLSFIPPPPDFMGDLNSLDLAALQPPSMPAPKPAFPPLSMEEEDLSHLKPPPMAPPKPPSTCSSGSASSIAISSPSPTKVPERPKFAPPQPPSERQHKTHKTPPPKPIRLSSVSNFDPPPHTPAPPPPVHTPTLSTFNPQNTAKLYNVPKTKLLCVNEDHDARPKQMLLLEDSGSVNSLPVLVQVDGEAPKVATPPKPAPKDAPELKENLKMIQPSKSPLPELHKEAKTEAVSPQSEVSKPPQSQQPQKVTNTISPQSEISKPPQSQQPQKVTNTVSPQSEISKLPQSQQPQKGTNVQVNSETSKKLEVSPRQSHNFSPMLDRKLRNLRANEIHGARDGHAASPLALLMAAKEREKHRATHSLSREGSTKKSEEPRASIPPSDSSPSPLNVISRSGSSSLTPTVHRLHESTPSVRQVEHAQTIQSPEKSSCPDQIQSSNPALSRVKAAPSLTVNNLAEKRQSAEQSPSVSQAVQHNNQKGELNIPLLPPPPEFDDFNEINEPPPSIRPPDPPLKKVPTPPVFQSPAPASAPAPAPLPNHTPPPPPKLPPSDIDIKPKPQVQTKPKPAPAQLPPALSPSQATLLGILQKKMLEMDHKMAPATEAESTSDEWATTLSDEDNKIPVAPKAKAQAKNSPVVNKSATLDMRELESKVARKFHENSQVKAPTSNGPHSKYQHGKTFTIRPGTKQPITLVTKEDS
ncbi:uncharacterized protein PAE49_002697 [Odontesthes bonariensis]|uniref:uncharacterized protein LOC142377158 n=1 Tax=Odontesthes bonariensis TaxID=219752 RepID=UPI003F588E47